MRNTKEIFEALPHVDAIWLTADGNFHLHPNYGGQKIDRNTNDSPDEISISSKKDLKPRPRGRQKQIK